MSEILTKILEVKRQEIRRDEAHQPVESLLDIIESMASCRDFYGAITKANARGINVIAEIKRASPSAGVIFHNSGQFEPAILGRTYEQAGADAVSVLTDEQFFQGRLGYIREVKEAISLPVLRKDFLIDPYQIYQSRAAGADAILLIAEAIASDTQLTALTGLAEGLGLTVLLEVHQRDSWLRVRDLVDFEKKPFTRTLLGINNRNLKTMEVKIEHSLELGRDADNKKILISESGIKCRQDVRRLMEAGFNGVLIGETLMGSDNIAAKFAELFGSVES
jgi:indole-3-glycerol phosphate synthase